MAALQVPASWRGDGSDADAKLQATARRPVDPAMQLKEGEPVNVQSASTTGGHTPLTHASVATSQATSPQPTDNVPELAEDLLLVPTGAQEEVIASQASTAVSEETPFPSTENGRCSKSGPTC